MKHQLAIGSLLLVGVVACGGGTPNNVPDTPQPPTPAAPTQAESTPQPAPTPTAAETPAPAAPDNGGYALVPPAKLQYNPVMPGQPGPDVAVVHGDLKTGASFFLRIPAGAKPGLHTHSSDYQAVVISGA